MPDSTRILLASYKDAQTSAETPFLFKRAGCATVDVYAPRGSWLLKNRYRDAWHEADASDPARYADALARTAREGRYDWVVFIDDEALYAAHDHLDDADAARLLPVTDLAYKGLAASKAALSLLSEAEGIRTPAFAIHDGARDIRETARDMSFPLLLKVDRSGGGLGIRLCEDEAGLIAAFDDLSPEQRQGLLVQSYIRGETVSAEALYREGALVAYARSVVLRTAGDEFSISIVREYSADGAFEAELARIGDAFGFDGFCSFTFIRGAETGEYFLVEADLRTHAWFALSRFSGADFSEGIRRYLAQAPGVVRQPDGTRIEIRHFSRDLTWSLKNRDLKNLVAWACNSGGRWRFLPFHDPRLLVATIAQLIRKRISETRLYPLFARK